MAWVNPSTCGDLRKISCDLTCRSDLCVLALYCDVRMSSNTGQGMLCTLSQSSLIRRDTIALSLQCISYRQRERYDLLVDKRASWKDTLNIILLRTSLQIRRPADTASTGPPSLCLLLCAVRSPNGQHRGRQSHHWTQLYTDSVRARGRGQFWGLCRFFNKKDVLARLDTFFRINSLILYLDSLQ